MCANRRDARAALEVATKALEEIRDRIARTTGPATTGAALRAADAAIKDTDSIASRALATIRGMAGGGQ